MVVEPVLLVWQSIPGQLLSLVIHTIIKNRSTSQQTVKSRKQPMNLARRSRQLAMARVGARRKPEITLVMTMRPLTMSMVSVAVPWMQGVAAAATERVKGIMRRASLTMGHSRWTLPRSCRSTSTTRTMPIA